MNVWVPEVFCDSRAGSPLNKVGEGGSVKGREGKKKRVRLSVWNDQKRLR
jgi:hypothetical protein